MRSRQPTIWEYNRGNIKHVAETTVQYSLLVINITPNSATVGIQQAINK